MGGALQDRVRAMQVIDAAPTGDVEASALDPDAARPGGSAQTPATN